MTSLRRTFVGPFTADRALSLETLTVDQLANSLWPMKSVLTDEPLYSATVAECAALLQGRTIPCGRELSCKSHGRIAVLDAEGELFAFATGDSERGLIIPQRVFVR